MQDLIVTPKGWVEAFGEIVKFAAQIVREVFDAAGVQVLRRGAAPGRDPDRLARRW